MFGRLFKLGLAALLMLVAATAGPIVWIETQCDAPGQPQAGQPLITNKAHLRDEAKTYLTYPEWHIVYAYQELARLLEDGDEHRFGYLQSVTGFWRSLCELKQESDRHGGSESMMSTIYTIGASFNVEMGFKALYEETIGRLSAWWRGAKKTEQDQLSAQVMSDYAQFLHQTPWYQYDFAGAIDKLWAAPVSKPVRGWERRLALGAEWKAKALYAKVIARAVESVGHDELTMRSIVTGMPVTRLGAMPGVKVIGLVGQGVEVQTPRYRAFTQLVREIAKAGGSVQEIAGNDDILVTVTGPSDAALTFNTTLRVLGTVDRQGFGDKRFLIDVKVQDLTALLIELKRSAFQLEHIHDY